MAYFDDSTQMLWRIRRIGGVLRSVLMFICGTVLLAAAAFILEPKFLLAVTKAPQPATHSQRMYNEFAESLASLISESVEVLAINNHSPAAQASVVLWKNDDSNPGVIDPSEVVVISHSQLLRTINVYSLDTSNANVARDNLAPNNSAKPAQGVSGTPHQVTPQRPNALRLSGPLDREAVSAPVFCDRWRATPAVQPRTIGTGIADMRIEPVNGSQKDFSVLHLWLRWSPDSADGAGEATAVIVVGAQQES